MRGRREMVERLNVREAQADEIRKMQRPRARNVSKRVAPHIVIVASIRQLADADAIKDAVMRNEVVPGADIRRGSHLRIA